MYIQPHLTEHSCPYCRCVCCLQETVRQQEEWPSRMNSTKMIKPGKKHGHRHVNNILWCSAAVQTWQRPKQFTVQNSNPEHDTVRQPVQLWIFRFSWTKITGWEIVQSPVNQNLVLIWICVFICTSCLILKHAPPDVVSVFLPCLTSLCSHGLCLNCVFVACCV